MRLPSANILLAMIGGALVGHFSARWLGIAGAFGMVAGALAWWAFETRRFYKAVRRSHEQMGELQASLLQDMEQ